MSAKKGDKGLKTEELLRAYFLRAGFFVLRGIPVRVADIDLTDVDLWVYERSATLARRRTIIDIKDKRTPQAAERIFFVLGLARAIGVEGCGVATADARPTLREFAKKQGVLWLDGGDLQRLKSSKELQDLDRLTEEALLSEINSVDRGRQGSNYRRYYETLRGSVATKFGVSSGNVALDCVQQFALAASSSHPGSEAALLGTRLTYMAGAVAAASFDYAAADSALRPVQDRLDTFVHYIRYGHNGDDLTGRVRLAEALIREYAVDGNKIAQTVGQRFKAAFDAIPSEALAEAIVRLSRTDALFEVARILEAASYATRVPSFDVLPTATKIFLGATLDFAAIDRLRFAESLAKEGGPAPSPLSLNETGELFTN